MRDFEIRYEKKEAYHSHVIVCLPYNMPERVLNLEEIFGRNNNNKINIINRI